MKCLSVRQPHADLLVNGRMPETSLTMLLEGPKERAS